MNASGGVANVSRAICLATLAASSLSDTARNANLDASAAERPAPAASPAAMMRLNLSSPTANAGS